MCVSERDGQKAQARAMLTSFVACTSAPFASSATTTSKKPCAVAAWSGVSPLCGAGEHRGHRLPLPSFRPACPHQRTHSEHTYSCTMCFGMLISLDQIHSHAWMDVFNGHCSGDRDFRCNTHSPKHNHIYRRHNQMSVTGSVGHCFYRLSMHLHT